MTKIERSAEIARMEQCILKLYDDGLSAMEIVDQTKQSKSKVYGILKKHNKPVKLMYINNDAELERELETHKGANAKMDRNAKKLRPGAKISYTYDGKPHNGTVVACFPYYVSVIDDKGHRHSPLYQDVL